MIKVNVLKCRYGGSEVGLFMIQISETDKKSIDTEKWPGIWLYVYSNKKIPRGMVFFPLH